MAKPLNRLSVWGEVSSTTNNTVSVVAGYSNLVSDILLSDEFRVGCLHALRDCQLPQGYIGAGFVRNAIWDHTHNKTELTPLNDVDVVYFDKNDVSIDTENRVQSYLTERLPKVRWQVKNQARMHQKHGHSPYISTEHAISHWIERETCVAVRLTSTGACDVIAPFGLACNFANTITLNSPAKLSPIFIERIVNKGWQTRWPNLQVCGIALSSSLR
ncbi:nucleotidyltransferase family protein [Alteromonas sp. KUL49]|uniref:nucleotidyltransferase family protein n=1 Tax=Alteromonas sp. KUL49 TaxID=2480798 RepID=UPI001F5F8BEA|nr:nucleotidyltransferase family protein [Alteromonas sp. KUL49]